MLDWLSLRGIDQLLKISLCLEDILWIRFQVEVAAPDQKFVEELDEDTCYHHHSNERLLPLVYAVLIWLHRFEINQKPYDVPYQGGANCPNEPVEEVWARLENTAVEKEQVEQADLYFCDLGQLHWQDNGDEQPRQVQVVGLDQNDPEIDLW